MAGVSFLSESSVLYLTGTVSRIALDASVSRSPKRRSLERPNGGRHGFGSREVGVLRVECDAAPPGDMAVHHTPHRGAVEPPAPCDPCHRRAVDGNGLHGPAREVRAPP